MEINTQKFKFGYCKTIASRSVAAITKYYNVKSSFNGFRNDTVITLELEVEFIKFFWYRFLCNLNFCNYLDLVGNPVEYSAENFEIIIDVLLVLFNL